MEGKDGDEDLFVVIVGDATFNKNRRKQVLDIKTELDETNVNLGVEDLIQTAEKYGQAIDISSVKGEPPDEPEYLDSGEEYTQGSSEDSDDECLDFKIKRQKRSGYKRKEFQRHKMLAPHERRSFVEMLRNEHPELAEDEELMIETLCRIMLDVKRPDPPQDYFIMNNIMFECVQCGALTDTMPASQRHWQEKHGPRYLICYACGVDFRSTTNLYKHEKRCNAPDATVVLKARARTLGRKGRGRPYYTTTTIKSIWNVTSQKKEYPCSVCAARFLSRQSLHSHELKHTGERPYRCAQCPAAYTSACGLAKHKIKHTNIEFICDHCGRSCKSKGALIVHLDTHKPLRKYQCEECGRRFAQNMALKLHVARVHLNLPPPCACQICPKRYPRMSLLKTHMLKEHGMNLITRKMFYKTLPMLTETQLQSAKVVLKSELGENEHILQNNLDLYIEQTKEKRKLEIEEQQNAEVDLTEELMEYIKNIEQGQLEPGAKYIVIQNGEAICLDGDNVDFYKNQLISEVEQELDHQLQAEGEEMEDNKEDLHRRIQMIKYDSCDMEAEEEILCETSGVVTVKKRESLLKVS